ncbi:MAG: VOC family protein [Reichenbachiella sp.]|uniref:VOC family protein n=1 Tax=Reichenbachiella sp. TaxID=2184521 RepID=UPI003262D68D
MRKTILSLYIVIGALCFVACTNKNNSNSEALKMDSTLNQNVKNMNSYISIFEIPATDISRAIKFYQAILDLKIEKMDIPGMQMGVLPYEGQLVTGVIIQGEGYQPSSNGITIYLNAGENLQIILNKVEKNGGKIMVPKTQHADENGYFALFIDSEGNKMGLNSSN